MPLGGFVESDATYTLSADCKMTGILYIVNGATVTINGNGQVISRNGGLSINTAGQLNIRNAIFSGGSPIIGFQRNHLRVRNTLYATITIPSYC